MLKEPDHYCGTWICKGPPKIIIIIIIIITITIIIIIIIIIHCYHVSLFQKMSIQFIISVLLSIRVRL